MRVILFRDIPNTGRKNDIKEVSDGYARNFLFPKKLAAPATDEALKILAKEKAADETRRREAEKRSRDIAGMLAEKSVTIKTKMGERGKAFGAVTASKIRDALAHQEKIDIEKEWLELAEPIKTTGEHKVKIKFPGGIEGALRVVVLPEE